MIQDILESALNTVVSFLSTPQAPDPHTVSLGNMIRQTIIYCIKTEWKRLSEGLLQDDDLLA